MRKPQQQNNMAVLQSVAMLEMYPTPLFCNVLKTLSNTVKTLLEKWTEYNTLSFYVK